MTAANEGDVQRLESLLRRYEAVSGLSNEETDPVMIDLARAGGSAPDQELFEAVGQKKLDPADVAPTTLRPWYWILDVAAQAERQKETLISVRAAFFITFWSLIMDPRMTDADTVTLGIHRVPNDARMAAAQLGLRLALGLPEATRILGSEDDAVSAAQVVAISRKVLAG